MVSPRHQSSGRLVGGVVGVHVEAPKVTKKAKAFFTEEELAALLKTTCSGSSFVDWRDIAIMRVFIDTGIRVSGLAGLRYDSANDVFLTQRRLRIRLKGGDETWVPVGKKAAAAISARGSQRRATPYCWTPPTLDLTSVSDLRK